MAYIFMDESGDLGFNFKKKRTSKFLIITILFTENKKPIEKIVKKAHSSLKRKHKQKSGVLHSYHEKPITRKRLLKLLAQKDIKMMAIYLNKSKVYTKLQDQKEVLYNYVTNILLDRICTKKIVPLNKGVELIASRKETSKFLNLNFKNYLQTQAKANHNLDLKIEIKTTFEEKTLQAVDFISWSIFRKYEYEDESYYDLFKKLIFEENALFK